MDLLTEKFLAAARNVATCKRLAEEAHAIAVSAMNAEQASYDKLDEAHKVLRAVSDEAIEASA